MTTWTFVDLHDGQLRAMGMPYAFFGCQEHHTRLIGLMNTTIAILAITSLSLSSIRTLIAERSDTDKDIHNVRPASIIHSLMPGEGDDSEALFEFVTHDDDEMALLERYRDCFEETETVSLRLDIP